MTAYQRRIASAELKVLQQIKHGGGFSVFWATENIDRARAIDRLHWRKHCIAPRKGAAYGKFPWCNYYLTRTGQRYLRSLLKPRPPHPPDPSARHRHRPRVQPHW